MILLGLFFFYIPILKCGEVNKAIGVPFAEKTNQKPLS